MSDSESKSVVFSSTPVAWAQIAAGLFLVLMFTAVGLWSFFGFGFLNWMAIALAAVFLFILDYGWSRFTISSDGIELRRIITRRVAFKASIRQISTASVAPPLPLMRGARSGDHEYHVVPHMSNICLADRIGTVTISTPNAAAAVAAFNVLKAAEPQDHDDAGSPWAR